MSERRPPRPGRTAPFDPTDPFPDEPPDPIDPHFDPETLTRALFDSLDPELPLALLPVRIETRYTQPPAEPELLVRLYPDVLHADGHKPALTPLEISLGKAYWERASGDGDDTAEDDAAFAWLAGQLGPWRAAWVARALQPRGTVPLETRTVGSPTLARLLPDRFVVLGYRGDDVVGRWFGAQIPADLPLAPDLVELEGEVDGPGLLDAQGLAWTHDFQAAVDVGMALRIPLGAAPAFSALLVMGARAGDQRGGLEVLLDAHRFSDGLDLIGQGTPTNTTETSAPGAHPDRPDLVWLRAAALDEEAPGRRPEVDGEGDLYRQLGADAASVALGLGRGNALDSAAHAGLAELPNAEAMNRALWPALLGHYFDHLLGGVLDADGRSWVRDFATHFVRGGGPLPTLLAGAQPYGLLPVSLVIPPEQATSEIRHVELTLTELAGHWAASLHGVSHLDSNSTDHPPGETAGDVAAIVSRVLAAVPHPTGLRLRQVDAKRAEYVDEYYDRLFQLGLDCLAFFDPDGDVYGSVEDNAAWDVYSELMDTLNGIEAFVVAQRQAFDRAVEQFAGIGGIVLPDGSTQLFTAAQKEYFRALGTFTETYLFDLVEAHRLRTEPVWLMLQERNTSISGLMGDGDDPEAFFAYHGEAGTEVTWTAPLVAAGADVDAVAELQEQLADISADLASGAAQTYRYDDGKPLLIQLLRRAVEEAHGNAGDADLLALGLETLSAVAAGPDAAAELERLLRETLGSSSYRLDAWYTAVAAWRLENKRAKRPLGLQVGAYGFVVDLHPRAARASQGYVLAPSPAQATTAAVLRSGWSALGGDAETAGLAVDLSSDRLRRAEWLIDGVRRGQELGELLGSRCERRLLDAGLPAWIEPLRQAALEAIEDPRPPNGTLDGLLMARARSGATDLDDAETRAKAAIATLMSDPDRPDGDPTDVLDELVHDLDAVADAAVAQSVHSLVQGNLPEANATLTAAGTGEIAFPQLRFADTPRPAVTIAHRLVLLLDQTAVGSWPGAQTSGRALASPALEAWAGALLGDAKQIEFAVHFDDPESGRQLADPVTCSLAELGVAALDLVYLVPAGDDPGTGALGALVAAFAQGLIPANVPVHVQATVRTDVGRRSVDDAVQAARSLRKLVSPARDLDARDLAEPGTTEVEPGIDASDLSTRSGPVRASLEDGRERLAQALRNGDVREAMLSLAGFALPGGIPVAFDDDALAAAGEALRDQIDLRLKAASDTTLADAERLALLVGELLPLAARFIVPNGSALDASFARPRLGGRAEATAWLAAAGRVEPGARRLRVAVDLVEAVADATRFDFHLGQLPDYPGEDWVATAQPVSDERGRLCLLTTGAAPAFGAGPVAGLVLGSWSELMPGAQGSAAVAFHFDAPSTRAPQAILLCCAENEQGFSLDLVRDMLLQTIDLTQRRAIGPETLEVLGQYLPGAYGPAALAPAAAT